MKLFLSAGLILTSALILSSSDAQDNASSTIVSSNTYTNPILDAEGADPWVIRYGDYYYMTYTTKSATCY